MLLYYFSHALNGSALNRGSNMNQYTINVAGLSYIAEQTTELTGKMHTATCPAVLALAAAAEESASANDSAAAAQVELRAHTTLSRRPEIIYIDPAHVTVAAVSEE